MNRVILSGRIARDIELRSVVKADGTTSGVANFSIACSRGKDDVDFINATAFGKTAEMISNYFSKGSGIEIEGSIRVSNYTNKDGQKIYRTDVWVERVEFPKASKGDGGNQNNAPASNNAPQYNAPPQSVNDPNLPFNNAPQTSGYVAPTPTPAQPTQQNSFYTNAPAQPTVAPTPTPQPTPTPPVTPAQQNPYNPYGGGWQNDFASAPFN